jgi:hypothetical protein
MDEIIREGARLPSSGSGLHVSSGHIISLILAVVYLLMSDVIR